MAETQYYEHGRFNVSGDTLPNAITAYRTYGNPNNPCIVLPICYGAKLSFETHAYLIGEGKALDTTKYFVVTFTLFSNGESSSPSNTVRILVLAKFSITWDANDLIKPLHTWQNGDVSKIRDDGDLEKTLKSIRAKALIIPSKFDFYFPVEDSEYEISHLVDARLAVIPTTWGHAAGGGENPADVPFITERIKEFSET